LYKVKEVLGGVKSKILGTFGQKLNLDCGVCPPNTILGNQTQGTGTKGKSFSRVPGIYPTTPVLDRTRQFSRVPGVGQLWTIKSQTGKGIKTNKTGKLLGVITRLSGSAGSALRGLASAVGLVTVAEIGAAVAGSAMFLPIVAGAAAAAAALYILTAGMRSNADTMRNYNAALKTGETRINELKQASENYKKKVTDLTAEKRKLTAAGKNVGYIEKEIQDARNKSAQAARDAAAAEEALKKAREEHERIKTESTTSDTDYTAGISQKLRESGKYSEEELANLDKQNAALRDGTALKQHGLNEKKRIHGEGLQFISDIMDGKNPQSETWSKNKKAIDEYTVGMDSLAKLEEEYMNADSWTEKAKIWLEQGITKMQVDWINAMVVLGASWEGFTKSIGETGAYITGAWENTVKWFEGLSKRIGELGGDAGAYIMGAWGNTVKWVTDGWNGFVKTLRDTYNWIKGAWNNTVNWLKDKWVKHVKPIMDVWNGFVKKLRDTYNWIKTKWHETTSWLKTQWDTYVHPIIDGAAQLGAALQKTFDDAVAAARPVLNILNDIKKLIYGQSPGLIPGFKELGPTAIKSFSSALPIVGKLIAPLETTKNIIYGQSPGLIPGFKKLGNEVPRQVAKTLPYLTDLSNAMAIPSTSLEVSAIPSLDASVLDSLSVPLTSTGNSGGYNLASSSSVVSNSSVYHDHNHYHEPITINAKDMSYHEFQSTLISILEEGNRRYTPP
jgi:hypothetical protein